ncbi:ATP-binding protein [Streptoalloteichus hindustanus]|nr:tetratricopeptide repeat protein [Streptoalloteichus hindustanus]
MRGSGRAHGPETPPDRGEALGRNDVSADSVGVVVQAGVVHGGLHVQPPPEPVVPRQLPAAPAPFTGRAADLAELDRAVESLPGAGSPPRPDPANAGTGATVVISAIGGAGGIGKTWLALTWAHRHADRFPDGQLFVDLRGFSPEAEPMPPAVAVRGFLDALGVDPARVPADTAAQTGLYRSLVARRRMLVVLDNAATAEQVAPLLPGGGPSVVVVTSRNRLTGLITRHGARPLHLDTLTDDEARALLVGRLGVTRVATEADAVADLIRWCGGFPLALGLVAGRARSTPQVPLAEFVAELREFGVDALDDDDPAASLPTVLSLSLRGLTPRQRTVFGLLGVAPGPDISLPAVASLADLRLSEARGTVRALEDASLQARQANGRFSPHDLVRGYATTIAHRDLTSGTREAALRRVLDFYTHTAYQADRLLEPHRTPIRLDPPARGVHPHPMSDAPAALAWFDAEHANLLAAQHTAATRGLHHLTWRLAWALTTFHNRRGRLHDRLVVWRAAVDAAAHLPDPAARPLALRLVGLAQANLGRHEEAVEHLRQALALAERQNDRTHQALVHRMLARAWMLRGDDRRALGHASQALDLYRGLDLPVFEAEALNAVGWCAARLDDHDTARAHCEAALALHQRHHHVEGEAGTLDSLGYIAHRTGNHREAVRRYRQALALFRALGHSYQSADTLDHLGRSHLALGHHEAARVVWREALGLYRRQERPEDVRRVRQQLDGLDCAGRAVPEP